MSTLSAAIIQDGAKANGVDKNLIAATVMNEGEYISGILLNFKIESGNAEFVTGGDSYSGNTDSLGECTVEVISQHQGTSVISVSIDGMEGTTQTVITNFIEDSSSTAALKISLENNNADASGVKSNRVLIESISEDEINLIPDVELLLILDDPIGEAFFSNGEKIIPSRTNESGRCFIDILSTSSSPVKIKAYTQNDLSISAEETINFLSPNPFINFLFLPKDAQDWKIGQALTPGYTYDINFWTDSESEIDVRFETLGEGNFPDGEDPQILEMRSTPGEFIVVRLQISERQKSGTIFLKAISDYGSCMVSYLIKSE